MSIEHSDISFGEIHPVANWVLTSGGVAALGSIAVSDADIGKVAWVAGAGHFVLAAVAPTLWETLGLTLSSAVYADQLLTLTFSDNSTVDVEILSMSAGQVQTYVEGVLASYVTGSALTEAIATINTALSGKEPTIAAGTSSQYWRGDKTWQALNTGAVTESTNLRYLTDAEKARVTSAANTSTDGYLTSTNWNTFNGKQNALADVITANTYGSSTQYPIVTVNANGIVTGITLQAVPTPTFTDATFAVQRNGSPSISATWSLSAFTASHIHTYPDKDINFGNLSFIATTDRNVLGGTRNRIVGGSGNTVSGTDNVILASSNCAVSSTQCTIIGSTAVTLAGTAQRNVTVSNVVLGNSRSFTFPSGTLVTGSSASGSVAHIKTFSAFRLSKPDSGTVLVQDVNNVKPYAVFSKYSPSYADGGLHRVTVLGTLNANNYTVRNVLVRRDTGVTVTTIEAGGGYITLSAAQNGDRLDLTVSTTYSNAETFTVFVESYYTDCG